MTGVTAVPIFSSNGQRSGLGLGLRLRSGTGGRPHNMPALGQDILLYLLTLCNNSISSLVSRLVLCLVHPI